MSPIQRMEQNQIKRILEAALLASAQPLSVPQLAALFGENEAVTHEELARALEAHGPHRAERGKELKEMVGYRIYRKQLVHNADLVDKDVPYELLTLVPDLHVEEREKMRKDARDANLPARRLDVGKEAKQFSFRDETAVPGTTYAYRIVPVNVAGGEGEVRNIIKVEFRGSSSDVTLVTNDETGEEIFG